MATKTEKNVQLKINKMTKNIFDQLSVQGLISEDELYLLSDDETGSATWGNIGGELSNQTDLKIMLDSKANKSEIPTVNNPTITFTQGNAVKGSITLNQANDQTISLDAGGGGGGEIPADLSCNNLSVGTSVSLGLGSTASGEYGSIAQGAYSKATANAAVALGSQCYATAQMSYAIGHQAEARHMNSMVLALADNDTGLSQSKRDNSLNIYVGRGYYDDALTCVNINGNDLQYIIRTESASLTAIPYYISNSTQTGSYIQVGGTYSQWNKGIFCFEVEAPNGNTIKYKFKDTLTDDFVEFEYYLGPTNSTGQQERCGAVITVPCVLDSGVTVYNDWGMDMTVRELYRIEFKDFYN